MPLTPEPQLELVEQYGGLEVWGTELIAPHSAAAWAGAGRLPRSSGASRSPRTSAAGRVVDAYTLIGRAKKRLRVQSRVWEPVCDSVVGLHGAPPHEAWRSPSGSSIRSVHCRRLRSTNRPAWS
jgi:hypothetical protein